jgi:hypothetical protein
MPSTSEVRSWLRDNGYAPPAKGVIPADLQGAYDAAHPAANGTATMTADYPDEDFEAAFADPPPSEDQADTGETPPKKPRAKSTGTGRARRGRFGFGKTGAAKGKKKPRVSTEDLLGSVWRGLAKIATPLPPLQRTLRVQAPVAGLLLEEAVKDTAVDVVLQPFARLANQGKTVSALLGPPVIVTAMTVHVQQRMQQDQAPNPLFMSVASEALRSALMTWMDVAGPKFEIAMQREQEFEEKYGKSVDEFMNWLFSRPVNIMDEAAVQAEEDAIRRAQGIL